MTYGLFLLTVVLASLGLIAGALVLAVRDWWHGRPSPERQKLDALGGIFDGRPR